MSEKSFGRNALIVLGIACIVFAVGLVVMSASFTSIIGDENNKISALSSQILQLESNVTSLQNQASSDNSTINSLKANVTHLQDQLNSFITPAFKVDAIADYPSAWENQFVVVEGKLTGPLAWMTAISWGYELSMNGTLVPQTELGPDCIGVDLGGRGHPCSAENVVVIGVVRKGYIGTIIVGEEPMVSYYIEAEFVIPK